MTLAFQDNILKFCLNTKEGKKHFQLLDDTCFDLPDRQFVFSLVTEYLEKYGTMPSKVNLCQYFDNAAKKVAGGITMDAMNEMLKTIDDLFVENFVSDTTIIRDEILKFSQRKQTKELFKQRADGIKEGDEAFFEKVWQEMGKIVNLAKNVDEANNRGGFLLRDFNGVRYTVEDAHPTYLNALNDMTASGGFKTPELIIFMGAPKSFKTGTLLNIGGEYMRNGLKGYYADCENGINAIKSRFYQQMMQSTKRDLYEPENELILEEMVRRYKMMGGDIEVDYYPAHSKTIDDVDANLQYLWDEYGWKPDFIMWDYPDLFKPRDKTIKEKRLIIQAVYHDIIWLHNKWSVFGLGLSQVSKGAVEKDVISMKDFAEDFGKAMNAHAAFAICGTADEIKAGTRRIIPVMQREGVPFTGSETCYIQIDAGKQTITEFLYTKPIGDAAVSKSSVSAKVDRPAAYRPSDVTDD